MKAIKLTTNDVISVVDIQEPTLQGMQEHVGGHIEIVRPYLLGEIDVPDSKSLIMLCNDDGKVLDMPENEVASELYDNPYDDIVGDVLIMAEGFVDGEPDIVGLTDEQAQALMEDLKNIYGLEEDYETN